jgi:RIO kinase 1
VANHEIKKLQDGEVEDTYAHAVAALTGNRDVVEAVAKKMGRIDVMTKSMQPILSASENKTARTTLHSLDRNTDDEESTKVVTFSKNSIHIEADSCEQVVSDSESTADSDEGSTGSSSGFVKVARTPEQLQEEKEAKRAERKSNKKTVKDARNDKRQTKIKKKDKKRAIKKTKAGNKNN